MRSSSSIWWKYGLGGPVCRRRTDRARAQFDPNDLAAFVATFKTHCKMLPTSALATTIQGCKNVLQGADCEYLANRCAPFVAHLLGCVVHVYGHQSVPLADARSVKDALVDFLFTLFTKISATSLPLTDQLVAILAQAAFEFRFGPAACASANYSLFASLVPISTAKKTLQPSVFVELFCVCPEEVMEVFLDVIHHYCSTYDSSKMPETSTKIMACLAVFDEKDPIRHFELQDWD